MTTALHAADLTITAKLTGKESSGVSHLYLTKDRARVEQEASSGKHVILFDAARQTFWMINVDKQTYVEITKEDVERAHTQMSKEMAAMREKLKALPPEQRKQVEGMMPGGMGAAAPSAPPIQYRKVGTNRVAQWTCDTYEGYQNKQKSREACIIDPKQLGATPQDFAVIQQFSDMLSRLSPMDTERVNVFDPALPGFPVRLTAFRNGQSASVWEVTDVQRAALPSALFQIPAGFQKERPEPRQPRP